MSGTALASPALELSGISHAFGATQALNNLNLRVERGEFLGLIGENGAGKTTTLRIATGLLRSDAGRCDVLGYDIRAQSNRAKAAFAYLPDDPMLYPSLTISEHLELVAALWDIPAKLASSRGAFWLERFNLADRRRERIANLSRGMQQKLALAAAMLHAPQLLILDEPLTGLDPIAAHDVKADLREYVKNGNTVIMTSHILELVERLATRIAVMANGRIRAEGTLDELRALTNETGGSLESVYIDLARP